MNLGQWWLVAMAGRSRRFQSLMVFVIGAAAGVLAGQETVGVYWGQNGNEGSLDQACASGLYSFVTLAYLTTFGNGRNPVLNLAGHCDPSGGGCVSMGASIERCQRRGVKVLLSIGGGNGNYSLNSPADALNVSLYLWGSFLGGAARVRPLGNVSLDGVNFDIQSSAASSPYWLDLAARLSSYSAQGTKVYLAASPQCPFPDSALGSALNSSYFDFIWVQFYSNPSCHYSPSNVTNLVSSWGKWTSLRNNATIFLGLPASPFAAHSGGYIPPDVLTAQIIPSIKPLGRYGGLVLWSRYHDDQNGYSAAVAAQAPNTTNTTDTNSAPPPDQEMFVPRGGGNATLIAGAAAGGAFVFLLIAASVYLYRSRRFLSLVHWKSKRNEEDDFKDYVVPGLPTRFLYQTLVVATDNFSEKLGEGGYGSVFAGTLADGTKIAVKCLDGVGPVKRSFLAEVEIIGSIHHINLVRLVGYCTEKHRALLVYEYMPNGSLDKWIFRPERSLDWGGRKRIISDIAKGLAYLHEECRQKIAHLDIKPQNILLDEDFNAKVADFGLSKLMDRGQNLVVSSMRGTIGYLAPDWLGSVITEKVDVYSFGVVVLEILCGRRNLDESQPEESMHLLSLFKAKIEENRLVDLVDGSSQDMVAHAEEAAEMMKLAAWCLQNDVARRPSMSVVVKALEGVVGVETDLDYNFFRPPAVDGRLRQDALPLSHVLPSILSGPR